ncbi:MAG: glutamine synthetase family protein [Paracoccaceae bacterium]
MRQAGKLTCNDGTRVLGMHLLGRITGSKENRMRASMSEQIASGTMAARGVLDEEGIRKAAALVQRVETEGLETIRLVFPDQHGILRGKTIVARALTSAFSSGIGVASTLLLKDTSHRTVFPVWDEDIAIDAHPLKGASDVLLVPDPDAFYPVPWSPHSAIMLCDVVHRSGDPVSISARTVLTRATDQLATAGYGALFGLEVEFQIFERVDAALDHPQATMPPAPVQTRNLTQGHQYLTETRYDAADEILDDIRRAADDMGLAVRTVEIEMGPSQFEFTFDPADPKTQADRFVMFRTLVKELCHRKGLHATFMAKPKLPNAAANGWHIHQSLSDLKTGQNLFMPHSDDALTTHADGWIAGLLDHASASCLLTTPTINGYKRYAPFQLAPNRIQWGSDNRGAMIRALLYANDTASRIENRVADTTANPYFAFAAQLLAGLDGIERQAKAPAPTHTPYDTDAAHLPSNLAQAIDAFDGSAFYRKAMGDAFVDYLVHIKRAEWDRYLMTVSDWEHTEYFNLF